MAIDTSSCDVLTKFQYQQVRLRSEEAAKLSPGLQGFNTSRSD